MSWRLRHLTTRRAIPRWWAQPSCSRFSAWSPTGILAPGAPSPQSRCRQSRWRPRVKAPATGSALLLQALLHLVLHQRVGDIVFVDVGDVLHGLASDAVVGDPLDVVEPHVGIEAERAGFAAQRPDSGGPGV